MAAGDANNPYIIAMNDGTEGGWEQQLARALATLAGGLGGRALAGNGSSAIPPQVLQLLDNSVARQGYQNPLFQATTQGVYDMLPTFAKTGTQLSGSLPSTIPASASGGGGGGVNGAALGGSAGMAALAALLNNSSGGGGALGPIFDAIKKLFHRNSGPTVQGNKPQTGGIGPDMNPYDPFQGWDWGQDYGPATPDPMPHVDTSYDFPYLDYEPGGSNFTGPMEPNP